MGRKIKNEESNTVIVDSLKSLGGSVGVALAALGNISSSGRDLISFAEDIDTKRDGREFLENIEVLARTFGFACIEDECNTDVKRGRPAADADAKTKAKAMRLEGHPISEIVAATGLSRATVYRCTQDAPVPDT
jgi:DNA invertase Pin-like site-specific DNA recombinase